MVKKLLCAAVVTAVAAVIWQNLDDVKRYVRISRM
ncbi:DUF6893 family small protein [Kitasatospora sp. NPDC004615]